MERQPKRRGTYRGLVATAAVSYSRKRVDKAGKLVRDFVAAIRRGDESSRIAEQFDLPAVSEAFDILEWWRSRHAVPLTRVTANLRHYALKFGGSPPTQRLKRTATIYDKLIREPTMALSKMEDIAGVRAILPRSSLTPVVESLQRSRAWSIRRIREYVDGGDPGPKDDGYRAIHVIVEKDACWVEIQLRTPTQDAWAQSVEQDTRRLRAALKFGGGPDDLREYYRMISDLFAMREEMIEPDEIFLEDLAELYERTRRYFPGSAGNS